MLGVFAETEDLGEDGQQLVEVEAALAQGQVGYWLVVIQNVEGEEVYVYLDLVYVGVFAAAGGQHLEGQQLAGALVYGHDLAVEDEALQLLLEANHVFPYLFH